MNKLFKTSQIIPDKIKEILKNTKSIIENKFDTKVFDYGMLYKSDNDFYNNPGFKRIQHIFQPSLESINYFLFTSLTAFTISLETISGELFSV